MVKANIVGGKLGMDKLGGGEALPAATQPTHANFNPHLTGIGKELRAQEASRILANAKSIFEIWPDVTQPRRAVPSVVLDTWDRQPLTVGNMLIMWWGMVKEESGIEIPVESHLLGEETERSTSETERKMGTLEKSFMDLIELAASIRRDGLIEPIMIAAHENMHQIVVGERRWLAHHLLTQAFPDQDTWKRIPAVVTDSPDVWKQAAENNNRVQLNAIGRARQLAILLMAVYTEQGHSFEPYDVFSSDREYYAQVSDGKEFPIPYGAGERIVQAMGLKNRVQLNQFRALLRLPDHYWRVGDDEDWTENRLREYLRESRESITVVIDSGEAELAVEADEPEAYSPDALAEVVIEPVAQNRGMQETPQGNPGGVPDWAITVLETAYTIAANNPVSRSWFNALQVKFNPGAVNTLVDGGYLDCRNPGNTKYDMAAYRINAVGAQTINRPPINFSQEMPPPSYPAAENDLYAGAFGSPKTPDQLPPRQTLPPSSPARRVGKVVQGSDRYPLENLLNMTVQSVAEDPLGAQGQVDKAETVIQQVKDYIKQVLGH